MQKQRMNRINVFAAVVGLFAGTKPSFTPKTSKVAPQGPSKTWSECTGTAGAYGMSIAGTSKYRAYKRKANRRLRAAMGGRHA